LTIALGVGDLANVRFGMSPLQHLVFALQSGTAPGCPGHRWWRGVRGRVPGAATAFMELVTANPLYAPDFLTPPVPMTRARVPSSIDAELEAVESVGAEQLRDELRLDRALGGTSRTARALWDGGSREVLALVDSARALYRSCLAPDWPDMHRRLQADVDRRRATMGESGLAALLAELYPPWQDPSTLTMEFPDAPSQTAEEMHCTADGTGVLLTPNLFLPGGLAPSLSPWQQLGFAYSAVSSPEPGARTDQDALAAVLGRGRAAALRSLAAGCTTTELAARMRVSVPTASVHAASLRAAGMVSTVRDGRQVLHTLTELGSALLDASPPPEDG
jgi:DNA-binding transcriptional ArsR family regulator